MNLCKSSLAGLALVVASCSTHRIVDVIDSGGPTTPRTVEADTFEPVPNWFMIELSKAGFRKGLFSRAYFKCSNHEVAHMTNKHEKVRELSQNPPAGNGCKGWMFKGALSK